LQVSIWWKNNDLCQVNHLLRMLTI
jgi:hypothetical protein